MPTLTPQEAKALSDLIGDMSEFWSDTDHDTAETDLAWDKLLQIAEGVEWLPLILKFTPCYLRIIKSNRQQDANPTTNRPEGQAY